MSEFEGLPNIRIDALNLGSDRQLPKEQRRGAIIILGMLALAKRSVVTDRVDTLLKVGLGPLGRVSNALRLVWKTCLHCFILVGFATCTLYLRSFTAS